MDAFELHCYSIQLVHQSIRRCLSQLILHIETIQGETKSFQGFMNAVIDFIHHHHQNEDVWEFPVFKAKGMLDNLESFSQQHSNLSKSLDTLHSFTSMDSSLFISNRNEIKQCLLEIESNLLPHFSLEESTITPDAFKKYGFTLADVASIDKNITNGLKKNVDPTLFFPVLYYNLTNQERKDWWDHVLPWFLRKILFRFVFCKKHKDYWVYSFNYN